MHRNDPSRGKPPNSHGFHYKHRRMIWADDDLVSAEGVAAVPGEAGGLGIWGWSSSEPVDSHDGPNGAFFQGGTPSPGENAGSGVNISRRGDS